MEQLDVQAWLIKCNGRVVGLSLIAEPQHEAEQFCHTLPKLLVEGTVRMTFEGERVSFTSRRYPPLSFVLSGAEVSEWNAIIEAKKPTTIYPDGMLTPGLKIMLDEAMAESMRRELERIPLTRASVGA